MLYLRLTTILHLVLQKSGLKQKEMVQLDDALQVAGAGSRNKQMWYFDFPARCCGM